MFIDVPRRKSRLQPSLRVFISIVVLQSIHFLDLVVLIVASVDYDGRVMSEPSYVANSFFSDRV